MTEDFLTFQEELLNTTREAKDLSIEYLNARKAYNTCFNKLVVMIQKAGLHKNKKSVENKFVELLDDSKYGEEAKKIYAQMLNEEATYKGLEVVCKAYANHSVALCSVMKNQVTGEISEAMKNKYSSN